MSCFCFILWPIFCVCRRGGSGSHRCCRAAAAKARWMAKEGQERKVRRGLGPAGRAGEWRKISRFVRGIGGAVKKRQGRCSQSCGLGPTITQALNLLGKPLQAAFLSTPNSTESIQFLSFLSPRFVFPWGQELPAVKTSFFSRLCCSDLWFYLLRVTWYLCTGFYFYVFDK